MGLMNKFILLLIASSLLSSSIEATRIGTFMNPFDEAANRIGTFLYGSSEESSASASDTIAPVPSLDLSPSSSPAPSPSVSGAVKKICDATDYPEDCMATVAPLLPSEADADKVIQVGIEVIQKTLNVAMTTVKSLNLNPVLSTLTKDCLDTCRDSYDNAISDMDDALEAIKARDIGTLQTLISASISYIDTCQSSFIDDAGVQPPLVIKALDEQLNKMAVNNMAISNMLDWN